MTPARCMALCCVAGLGFAAAARAQLAGTNSVGPTGDFSSLTAAITNIQVAGLSGPLVLELQPDYASGVESFPLVFSNLATTAANTLTIRPQVGATNLLITSGAAQTLELHGARFVAIDGRPGGEGVASGLTVANTSSNGVALRFVNDAQSNRVQHVAFQGVGTNVNGGVILFGGTTGSGGNDDNTIAHCDIRDGAGTPVNGVYASGATNTAAQANSGNTIVGCRIFNFHSGTNETTGVRLEAGNTAWRIASNSFYQTASRVAVTVGIRAVSVNAPAGAGFVISENAIGGSSPGLAGAPWSATAFWFIGIHLNVSTSMPSSVQGNVLGNMVWTNSASSTLPGAWCGIFLQSGRADIGSTTGNIIGSGTGTGSVVVTMPGSSSYGIGAAGGAVTIASNTVGGLTTVALNGAVSASLVGIQVTAGAATITGNLVGGDTSNSLNAITATTAGSGQQVAGIVSSSSAGAVITGNRVANLNNNYAGTASAGQVRGIVTSAGVNTIVGNTVRNLSTTSANGNGLASQAVLGIVQSATSAGQTVARNVVHTLEALAPAAAVNVAGIYFASSSSGSNSVAQNFIHGLAIVSTNTGTVVAGIQLAAGAFSVQNNMVRIGLDRSGAGTAGAAILRGIYDNNLTAGRNVHHNAVYVGGAQVVGASSSFAFTSIGASNLREFRNNIFVNARGNAGGTGKHHAVNYGGTVPNPTGLAADGNILLAPNAGGVLGRYNGVDCATLAAWQAATGQDAASAVVDPLFVNPTGDADSLDLHVQTGSPVEGGGILVAAVTDDFDGQARAGLTPVDIGADAGDFSTTNDVFAPVITYPLLGNGSTANRVLAGFATITDNSGVVSGGASAPRLYFKKATDADVFGVTNDATGDGWKFVTAGNGSSPYSFTIDYAIINGGSVMNGDVIQYFVVAQDEADNLGSSPLGGVGAATNPPVQHVNAHGSVNVYTIAPIGGPRTVGTGGDYPNLTGVNGLFAALNRSVVTSDVVVTVTSDLAEDGAVALNQFLANDYSATNTHTLLIRPADAAMKTIDGIATTGMIKLNGADRVTIDGRFNGAGRYLTFRNQSGGGQANTILLEGDACSNVVRNCVVEGATINDIGVIGIGDAILTGNDDNLIADNIVRDLSNAEGVPNSLIGSQNGDNAAVNSGNVISGNELFNFDYVGIWIGFQSDAWIISSNTIYELNPGAGSHLSGIDVWAGNGHIADNTLYNLLTTGDYTDGIFAFGTGSVTIARNRVSMLTADEACYWFSGITVFGISGGTFNVLNNQVTVNPPVTNASFVHGLIDGSAAGVLYHAAYNTVVIAGVAGADESSWADRRDGPSTHITRNNIFLNLRTGETNNHFAAGTSVSGGSYDADFNVYAGTGVPGENFMCFSTNWIETPMTFAQWQAATGGDSNSQASVPGGDFSTTMFVAAGTGDLHLVPGGNVLVNGAGVPVPGVTTDFDGDPRSPATPTIGSDEAAGPLATTTSSTTSTTTSTTSSSSTTTTTSTSTTTTVAPDDWDGDGLPNAWEIQYGFNPAISNAAGANSDGDGHTDWQEYVADTDPTNRNSALRTLIARATNGFIVVDAVPSSTSRVYDLWWTTNISGQAPPWSAYGLDVFGTGSNLTVTTTNPVPRAFFRFDVQLP